MFYVQLPVEIQSKVSAYMRLETNSDSEEGSTSGVGPVATSGSYKVLPASDSPPPSCPFPPTAMVYSMRGLGELLFYLNFYFSFLYIFLSGFFY